MRHVPWRVIFCAALFASPGAAQDQIAFDVRYRGLSVAEVHLAARETAANYALSGRVQATGLVAIFARVRFAMDTQGHRQDTTFAPLLYQEDVNTGQRQSRVTLAWDGPLPAIRDQHPPPGASAVPPEAAIGTLDPLTALWHLIRRAPEASLCNLDLAVYDGARRSSLRAGPPHRTGETITCAAQYSRVAGFSAEEMANRQHFPLTLTYRATGPGWQLTEVQAASLLGPIRIIRRN